MKSRKFTPPGADRDDELRRTVISSIMQELQHMDMDGLRNVLIIAEKQIEAQKKLDDSFLRGQSMCNVY